MARYNLHAARRDVVFIKTNGDLVYGRITTAEEAGANEVLTLEMGGGGSIPALAGVDRLSWLRYGRLQGDAVELEWWRAGRDGRIVLEVSLLYRDLPTSPD